MSSILVSRVSCKISYEQVEGLAETLHRGEPIGRTELALGSVSLLPCLEEVHSSGLFVINSLVRARISMVYGPEGAPMLDQAFINFKGRLTAGEWRDERVDEARIKPGNDGKSAHFYVLEAKTCMKPIEPTAT